MSSKNDEPPTVLVVEDDRALAVGLDLNLSAEGYRVVVARDGESGLRLALSQSPDLILLDLMLPGMDGMEVLRELRARGRQMPVIIVSARGEEYDKVAGLDVGADDYVTKPFGLKELVARINAALRRANGPREERRVAHFGDVEVDLDGRRVVRHGNEVRLTPREYDLLAFLLERPGRVCSRESLLAAVWGYDYEGTCRTVDNFIRNLRVKLEREPARPEYLVTVHGVGYQLKR
jgi:DNA-binding response OmpR family regulator